MVSTSEKLMNEFKKGIKGIYKLTDQGDIHNSEYLGMKNHYDKSNRQLHVSNDRKVAELLKTHGLIGVTPADSPCVISADRDNTPASADHKIDMFKFLGSLNHLVSTCRPDIATAVSMLSSIPDKVNITNEDQQDALRIGRYLARNETNIGLHYDGNKFDSVTEAILPVVYVDSDHKKSGDFRSRSGQIIYMCGAPVFWRSQLQKTIATSSTHAEVIAASDVCKRVVWMRTLLNELGFEIPPVTVFEDNQACISLIQGNAVSDRTRHIDVRCWWTRELRDKNLIKFEYVVTTENIADQFTKILTVKDQQKYIAKLCSSQL